MISSYHLLAAAMYFAMLALVAIGRYYEANLPAFHPFLHGVRFTLLGIGGFVGAVLIQPQGPIDPVIGFGQVLGWVAFPAGLGDWTAHALYFRYQPWFERRAAARVAARALREARNAR